MKFSKVIPLFQFKTVSSPLHVLENQCFEHIPVFYQNEFQMVDQVTCKTFPWSNKAPCTTTNFDQQILLDADGDELYRLAPYPCKAKNHRRMFMPYETENHFTNADFAAQQLGIYSQRDWTDSIDRMKFNQLVDDAAEWFETAQAVYVADLAKPAQ